MELREYFKSVEGTGVLATADADGVVNVAIYARPHFLNEGRNKRQFLVHFRVDGVRPLIGAEQ